jgi:Mrp family chromosome partitioning ATPase
MTERRAVDQALQQLDSVGARVVGAVLNDARGELRRYDEYYYYYSEDYAAVAD